MAEDLQKIRDRIIETYLPRVADLGWSWEGIENAAKAAGYQDGMAEAVFPSRLLDAVSHFSDHNDRLMLKKLQRIPNDSMRVRERIKQGAWTRLEVCAGHKEAVKAALAYWALPTRVLMGQRILWRSADHIWNWAGDTATDYNRQTKRALLASILMGTFMVYVNDESEGNSATNAFLDRRIEQALQLGQFAGSAIGTLKTVLPKGSKTQ